MRNIFSWRSDGSDTASTASNQTLSAENDRLLQAVQRLAKAQTVAVNELPDGALGQALSDLQALRTVDGKTARMNLAEVARGASEAAINVGWTTYDIGEIANSTQSIASAIEEMAASISEVSHTSQAAGESADRARTSMFACTEDVRLAREAMQEIETRTHQIDERLRTLAAAVAEIGTMASSIASISSQTNLLALNATIEAARAGEAGRGFAVVAAEVKSLSGQTARSTDQIRAGLTTLQSEMQQIAQAVEESRRAVEQGGSIVSNLGERVEEASLQITQTSDLSQALAATLEQQRDATAEVSGSVQGIAEKAVKTRTEIDNITKRLVKAENAAQTFLADDGDGTPTSELTRLAADLGLWKRGLADVLLGSRKADASLAILRGHAARNAVAALRGQPGMDPAAADRFLAADGKAHDDAARMITAIAAGNWDVGTPAFKEAGAAMKDMLTASHALIDSEL